MNIKDIARIGTMVVYAVIGCGISTYATAFEISNQRTAVPSHTVYVGLPFYFGSSSKYSFTTVQGPLKSNVVEMASLHHWSVNWCAKQFYLVATEEKISGPNFKDLAGKLLSHYPLQAQFDDNNKVLTVSESESCNTGFTKKPKK